MDKNIQIIKQISEQYLPYCIVILFGSRARKDFTDESDYDILIITDTDIEVTQKRDFIAKIRKNLAIRKIPTDILIHSRNEIEMKKKITGHIVKQAIMEGITL